MYDKWLVHYLKMISILGSVTNLLLGSGIRNNVIVIYPMIINDIDIAVKVRSILYFTDICVML